jgi:hypothetical protein
MALALSILFLSASILSFEIIVIRLLAISHWQPFVTLAISTALLGYGLSGSILLKTRDRVFANRRIAYPVLALAAALIYRPVIHVSGRLHLDPGLIIRDPYQWLKVGLLIAVLTLPFTVASGALALPLLERKSVGRYYGWNFVGAAFGVLVVLTTLGTLDPADLPKVPTLLAGLAVFASLFHFHRDKKGLALTAAAMVSLFLLFPSSPALYGPYKDISYAFLLPSAQEKAHRSGVTGKFQVVTAPALRSAAGLSTKYRGQLPGQAAIYHSGDRLGTLILTDSPHEEGVEYLKWQTAAAPFTLLEHGSRTAIAGFEGGEEAARAILHGSSSPVVIVPDRAISALVEENPDLFRPWIFGPGSAVMVRDSARSYLGNRSAVYDLIVYPAGMNLAAASAGLTGTAESYEITVQGIEAALGNLNSRGGIIALTGWNQFPPTGRWKLLGLLKRIDMLRDDGEFNGRVYLVTGWSNHTFLVRAEPFSPRELKKLSTFCDERGFSLTDGDQFPGPNQNTSSGIKQVWTDDLDLRPPTDNRPYPWHSLKFSYLRHLAGETREAAFPRVEWGFFFLIMVLALTTVFSLIALVSFRPGVPDRAGLSFSLYFGCLGMGYMTLEILLIKRSGLVMGPPAFTAAIILASFLVSSGLGSHVAGRMALRGSHPRWIFPAIVLLSGAAYLLIPSLLTFPAPARALILFLIAAPPAFVMGFPFPSALMLFERERESLVPRAWALNGYTSVIGSSFAGVLAVTMGYGSLFLLGTICYLAAGLMFGAKFN